MSEGKLKTGVLGLSDQGQLLLQAACDSEHFQIQAVADKDTTLAEKTAAQYECAAYDDYRQFIIQNQFDCLVVAAGMHSCDEYVRMAMKKKFNVLKVAPPARHFEEAAEFVRLAEDEGIQFAIANPRRFADSFVALREILRQGEAEHVFLMTAFCNAGNEPGPAWYTDPKLAGGGVLLRDCYEMVDQMLWNFPVPQQVYSLHTCQAADKQQRLYLTEDTAVVTMKFSDTLVGSLVAFRRAEIEPRGEFLRVYGKGKILTVSNTELTVSDGAAEVGEPVRYEYDALGCMARLLESFALSILSPDQHALCSSGRENLNNMAVIESAYLSARTGFPEDPGRIMQMASHGTAKPASM